MPTERNEPMLNLIRQVTQTGAAKRMIEILPNDNEKVREDRAGRIHTSRRRTWTVVVDGEFLGEYSTKREAKSEALATYGPDCVFSAGSLLRRRS